MTLRRNPPTALARSRHRGFVMIVAITLLGLVGATLAVMAMLFAGEAKRVQSVMAETQLRQLLIAGEAAARSRLDAGATTQPVTVELPPALAGASVTISGDSTSVRIAASYQGRHAAQTVSYVKDGSAWRISKLTLETP
jgi:hypothetical protein